MFSGIHRRYHLNLRDKHYQSQQVPAISYTINVIYVWQYIHSYTLYTFTYTYIHTQPKYIHTKGRTKDIHNVQKNNLINRTPKDSLDDYI